MIARAFIAIAAAALAGCAGSAYSIAHEDPAALKARSSVELCAAYRASPTAGVEQELRARQALTDGEWQLVKEKSVAIGMSKVAVICSWGLIWDGVDGNIHRTLLPDGHVEEQWVYMPAMDITKARYVYFSDDVVTALQN